MASQAPPHSPTPGVDALENSFDPLTGWMGRRNPITSLLNSKWAAFLLRLQLLHYTTGCMLGHSDSRTSVRIGLDLKDVIWSFNIKRLAYGDVSVSVVPHYRYLGLIAQQNGFEICTREPTVRILQWVNTTKCCSVPKFIYQPSYVLCQHPFADQAPHLCRRVASLVKEVKSTSQNFIHGH